MSAEKDIVNYWYNKKGFFTINNIKAGNRDIGIIALKFNNETIQEAHHIEVICSVSSTIIEKKADSFVTKIIKDKFENKAVTYEIKKNIMNFSGIKEIKKILILGILPNSRKKEVIKKFKEKGVEVSEFHEIIAKIFEDMDTQYYKNDIIRTMQLIKYLVLSKPTTFAWLINSLSPGGKEAFLKTVLEKKDVMTKLKKTDDEDLAKILKHASVKNPEKFAELIQQSILNRKTRKPFLDALLKMQGVRQELKKEIIRKEKSLKEFF